MTSAPPTAYLDCHVRTKDSLTAGKNEFVLHHVGHSMVVSTIHSLFLKEESNPRQRWLLLQGTAGHKEQRDNGLSGTHKTGWSLTAGVEPRKAPPTPQICYTQRREENMREETGG